jgi:malonyl-CoA/methylmalonyl-CoA synthetase
VPDHPTAGKATQVRAKDTSGAEVLPVPITLADNGGSANISIAIEDNIRFPADRPALVQFTSATTSPPKGVVHARKFFYYQVEVYFGCPMSEAKGLQTLLGADAVYLSYRSFHWGGGIRNATAAILAGVCTEIYNHDATPGDIWERLKRGDVTFFICRAAMWTQMKVYYEECLTSLPKPMLEEYIIGARRLRLAKSDSSLLTPSVKRFWNNLGVSIGINYAATETSITIGKQCVSFEEIDEVRRSPLHCMSLSADHLQRIIGVPLTGVSVKLSEGDHGEICIKTPLVFSQYE